MPALKAPHIDTASIAALAQENQKRSSALVDSAWASFQDNYRTQEQEAMKRDAQAAMSQEMGAWGQQAGPAGPYAANGPAANGARPNGVDGAYALGDRELLARTLAAEAGAESYEGQLAAGAVIMNRARSGKYGNGVSGVILKPAQFSAWNAVTGYAKGSGANDIVNRSPGQNFYQLADLLLSGQYQDPTRGATHYYAPAYANPNWGMSAGGDWTRIGNHVFGFADAGRN